MSKYHHLNKISDHVYIPNRIKGNVETFALYMGLFNERDKLKSFLLSNGIEVKIHYPIPLHKQKAANNNCLFSLSIKRD